VAGETRVTKELYLSPQDLWGLILSLGGVKFWVVSMAPLYIGWVLAQPPNGRHLFVDDLAIVLALIVVGPLLGTFSLLLNTYYDMQTTDRVNPRKRYLRIVEDLIQPDTLLLGAAGFAAVGLLLSFYIGQFLIPYPGGLGGITFVLLMLVLVALSVAYSHPAIRWKGVAGIDLVTNMVGFGLVLPAAGWSLLQPITNAPWGYFASISLFLGALYAPTTASDYASDREYGIRTLAVRLGVPATLRLGFGLLVAAAVALATVWALHLFPFSEPAAYEAMARLWPFVALQIAFYVFFLRRPSIGNIWALLLLLSIAQGLGVILFLFGFTGGNTWSR